MKDYYTLADLGDRSIIDEGADMPARLAVIGYPIRHSKSPQMQQAALDASGKKIRYIRVEAAPEEFDAVVDALCKLGFIGANVTVPHKPAAARLCDSLDALSKATGSVNTLVFPTQDAGMLGFNTDGPGFTAAIRDEFGVDIRDMKVLLLGACGGAGTALAYTCAMNRCEKLVLVDLPGPRLEELKKELLPSFIDERRLEGTSDRIRVYEFGSSKLEEVFSDTDLIVNATSLGLKPTDPSPVPGRDILPYHLVFDLQTHKSALQAEAAAQGARASNGLSMLLHQGALSYGCWFGEAPDLRVMKAALGIN